MRRIRIEALRK